MPISLPAPFGEARKFSLPRPLLIVRQRVDLSAIAVVPNQLHSMRRCSQALARLLILDAEAEGAQLYIVLHMF